MHITLKNLKANQSLSDETLCFSASVYVNGRRVGTIANRGCGGPCEIRIPQDELEPIVKYVDGLPPIIDDRFPNPLKYTLDLLFGELADEEDNRQHLNKKSKKRTLFRVGSESYDDGSWCVLSLPYKGNEERINRYFAEKYKNDTVTVFGFGVVHGVAEVAQ